MSIKTLWQKVFGKKKAEEEPPRPIIIRVDPPSLAVDIIPMTDKQLELFECFYGTLIDRPESEANEVNRHKKKHAHDGWREGHSHPFEFEGATYDVQYNADASLHLYEELMERVYATVEEEPLSEIIRSEEL